MLVLKYLLILAGVGLFGSAAALVVYDIFISSQLRRLLRRNATAGDLSSVGEERAEKARRQIFWTTSNTLCGPIRWRLARQFVISAVVPLLLALSIVVIPDGSAGVRISQIWGARPGTLYPGRAPGYAADRQRRAVRHARAGVHDARHRAEASRK